MIETNKKKRQKTNENEHTIVRKKLQKQEKLQYFFW